MSRASFFQISFLALTLLWLAWCLFWPYYAVRLETRVAMREAAETQRVCLAQKSLTAAECALDAHLYQRRLLAAAVPPGKTAYQLFAGDAVREQFSFMTLLTVVPPILLYGVARLSSGAGKLLLRVRYRPG